MILSYFDVSNNKNLTKIINTLKVRKCEQLISQIATIFEYEISRERKQNSPSLYITKISLFLEQYQKAKYQEERISDNFFQKLSTRGDSVILIED